MQTNEEVRMHTLSARALFCAGLVAIGAASVLPFFSPGLIEASGTPPPAAYGNCPAPANPGFNICNPGEPNSFAWETDAPVQLIAAATSATGQVETMEVWADGKKVAESQGSPFDAPINLDSGTHTLQIEEIDSTGASAKSAKFQVAVQGGNSGGGNNCSAPKEPGVHVCNPTPGGCNTQPWVDIDATGKGESGKVERMELWIEGTDIANFPGDEIGTSLIMAQGEFKIVEIDSKGNSKSTSFSFNGPC
jgi:Bacterial Ig domain